MTGEGPSIALAFACFGRDDRFNYSGQPAQRQVTWPENRKAPPLTKPVRSRARFESNIALIDSSFMD